MNQIGRKIYYDKATGNVILHIGEMVGYVRETTMEEDIATYNALSERNPDSFDVIQLAYGQYAQDFIECNGFRVNPETRTIEFSYPDPNDPEPHEPVYRKPLSEEVEDIKQAIAELSVIIAGGSE